MFREFEYGALIGISQIDRAGKFIRARHQPYQRLNHVVYITERARLAAIAKQRKIQYFFISYVDLFGGLRAKLVPARAIGEMQENGAGFAGFATWLDMTPADPDMFEIPDP